MTAPLLSATGLTKRFRGLTAVDDVSFTVDHGEIVALVGPNGAGKTTTFGLVAGAVRPDAGAVVLDGAALTGRRPHAACRAGIGRTFQIVRPFANLTVLENVVVAALHRAGGVAAAERAAQDVLALLGLDAKAHHLARSLTLPERKMLEVARALATRPKLLLLDEVMAGLRPVEVDGVVETLRALNREHGIAILLTEHVMRAVMALAHRTIVLHHGRLVAAGSPAEVMRDPQVLACYLGAAP